MFAKLKSAFSLFLALCLVIVGFSAPAQADGPAIDLVVANDSLAGTTISGFDSATTLRVTINTELGTITWPDSNNSGATLSSNTGSGSPGIQLQGTQDQLNAAISEITVNKPCSGSYKIYAQVTDSGFIVHPVTQHLYKAAPGALEFDAAIADAAATPLVPSGTSTFGYLATITDSIENNIVNTLGGSLVAASDRGTEGDWKWLAGPENGTSFYSGNSTGHTLPGMYSNWNNGEPNDSGNEDYVQVYGEGTWNDSNRTTDNYVIEWGGMPGDDLSSISIPIDNVEITIGGALTGNGTELDPYLVPNVDALLAVAGICSSPSAYFKQTDNITLPTDWAGNQVFQGHYDGNGHTISFAPNTVVTHNMFGVWSETSNVSTVSNLSVSGDLVATGYAYVGLLFGQGYDSTLNDVTVDGSISTSDGSYSLGGVVGSGSGTLNSVHSTVNIYSTSDGNNFAGLAGYYYGTINNSSWDGEINVSGSGDSNRVAGLVADTDCVDISHSSASGTITISNSAHSVGGFFGYFCGSIEESKADVDITSTTATQVGGLVGVGNGSFYRAAAYGNISGLDQVGGLIGTLNYAYAEDAYARGNVSATNAGGSLVGNVVGSTVYQAYATGTVTAGESRGIFGTYDGDTLAHVHWVPSQSTVTEPDPLQFGEVPYTLVDSKNFNYYNNEGWAISQTWGAEWWTICSGVEDGYPFFSSFYTADPCGPSVPTCTLDGSGTSEDPYLVGSVSDLLQTGTNLCSGDGIYFLQANDIYVPDNWAGDLTFVGNFDGDGWDLGFDETTSATKDYYGIWANVGSQNSENTTVIQNVYAIGYLNTSDGTNDYSHVGILAGDVSNTTFNHVWVSGSINIPNEVADVGGIAGGSTDSTFSYVTANIQIYSDHDASYIGGIVGFADACYFNDSKWDGGLVVMGIGNEIGGIAGLAFGTVFHDVRVGMNSETGIIVHGGGFVGGIAGALLGESSTSSYLYHNEVSIGISSYNAGSVGLLAGFAIDIPSAGNALYIYENIANGYMAGSGDSIGGLIGRIEGDSDSEASVHDNISLGYIYAEEGATNVGTLVGSAVGSTIRYNYSRGTLDGDRTGSQGIAGSTGNYTVMDDNIWSDTISGQVDNPLAVNVGEGEMQLTSTYYEHDFNIVDTRNLQTSSIWIRCNRVNDGYPFLRHFNSGYGCLIDQNVPTPTLSGEAPVGSVLTGDPGNWDVLTVQTYRWLRDGTPISGQTALTYTTTVDDAGHDITFEVTSSGLPADERDASATSASITVTAETSGGGGNSGGGNDNNGGGNSGGGNDNGGGGNSGGGVSTPTAFLTKSLAGFTDNSWLLPVSIKSGLRSMNRQTSTATSVLCVGIVAKFGNASWQRKVGLARARNACKYLKALHPAITFTLAYKTSKQNAKVRRGVALTFYR